MHWKLKALISTAYLCVTSRFHGVASALNSCVPCLATSWSHKYEELFRDYGMTDCVLDLNDMDAITQRISAFLSAEGKYCHKEVAGGTTTIYQARNLCNVENGLG